MRQGRQPLPRTCVSVGKEDGGSQATQNPGREEKGGTLLSGGGTLPWGWGTLRRKESFTDAPERARAIKVSLDQAGPKGEQDQAQPPLGKASSSKPTKAQEGNKRTRKEWA